ncbi:linear amide C-N hydrolase [Sphingobacterium spiritivorum]|uniref:linear amide C-N hydrolase n=1 Tax=Sphingobacterium spiritivorum TaxID=258 RepID=UPI003DA42E9C
MESTKISTFGRKLQLACIGLACGLSLLPSSLDACTRLVYKGPSNTVITARSMDWKDDIPANLWIFPRGMKRNGEIGQYSLEWTSRYGSLITSAFDIATTDGMNEKGLVANVLWLVESEYTPFDPKDGKKGLAISAWAQYMLDNFATVQEVVNAMRKHEFVVVSDVIPGTDKFTALHLSVSDAGGDNAIFEYIAGKLVIHHDPSYTVMTNSPVFDQQLALSNYWSSIPGNIMLPGTNRAADRFARAKFYLGAIPQTDDTRVAVGSVMSVIRNCSVPFGISSEQEPNISSTRWRSLSDHKNLVYYFETVLTPNTFWVDMKKVDFSEKGKVLKLSVAHNETYSGESSGSFKVTAPFKFAGATF